MRSPYPEVEVQEFAYSAVDYLLYRQFFNAKMNSFCLHPLSFNIRAGTNELKPFLRVVYLHFSATPNVCMFEYAVIYECVHDTRLRSAVSGLCFPLMRLRVLKHPDMKSSYSINTTSPTQSVAH